MANPILIIGNKNYSSWSMRPWLVLKTLGIDFQEERIPLFVGDYKERILRYSPTGKVPAYVDNGITVWDSLAICQHLSERHASLWPQDPAARAMARSVSGEMHSGFAALRASLPMNCRARNRKVAISEDVAADIARVLELWGNCRTQFGRGGPWLFGDFGIADALYAPVASRFVTYGIECDGEQRRYVETVMSDEHVRQWYEEAAAETEMIERVEIGET